VKQREVNVVFLSPPPNLPPSLPTYLPPLRINALSLSDSMEMVIALLKSPLMNIRPKRREGGRGGREGKCCGHGREPMVD